MDCIFCRIAAGEIPASKLYEDDRIIAFLDLEPKAPIHFLVIPKEHIASADEITEGNAGVIAHIFSKLPEIAKERGLVNGYRVVNNCRDDGGQSVAHLHFHILGGRTLAWPPG